MKIYLYILIALISAFNALQCADEPSTEDKSEHLSWYNTIWNDFNYVFDDYSELGNSILEFKAKDYYKLGTFLSATLVSMTVETELRDYIKDSHTTSRIDAFKGITLGGDIEYAIPFSGAVYLGGLIADNDEIRVTGRLLLESLALAGFINISLKTVFGRSRPYMESGNRDYRYFEFKDNFQSMPSGHSAVAFTIASVLSERIDNIYATVGLYGLASAVGFSRIYLDRHWLSDVIASAAIGSLSGIAISNAEKRNKVKYSREITIYPVPYGVGVLVRF